MKYTSCFLWAPGARGLISCSPRVAVRPGGEFIVGLPGLTAEWGVLWLTPPWLWVFVYGPRIHSSPSRARSGAGALGDSTADAASAVAAGSPTPRGSSSSSSAAKARQHRLISPQYLTAMLRSPQTPAVEDSTGWRTGIEDDPTTGEFLSPTFLRGAKRASPAVSPAAATATAPAGTSRPGSASVASVVGPPGSPGGGGRTGRRAMRAAVKEARWPEWGGEGEAAAGSASRITLTPAGTPSTMVYG